MPKLKQNIPEQLNTNYLKFAALIAGFFILFVLYNLYAWFNTQSTDNAYFESNITFVSPEVNGVIEKVLFVENQFVKKNDLLLKIKDDDYKSTFSSAKNGYEASQIAISIIDYEIEIAKLEIAKAQEAVSLGHSSAENSSKEFARISKLAKDNFSSKKLLDDASLFKHKSETELDQASLTLESAKRRLLVLEGKRNAQIFETNALGNNLEIAGRNFANTEVRAPIDGIITSSSARVGGYARVGMHMFAIVPKEDFYVKANFKETQISKFKEGMTAEVYFDAIGGKSFKGRIRNIYPATGSKFSLIPTDNATGNFTKIVQRVPVIIDVRIPEEYIDKAAIGMSCTVTVRTDQ
ncbi:MAG: HlyD family secretion protein [Rickettsiaceae bacterium]|nr:HlyD family secretion protein [Rickettsiaceae bacterium]